MDIENAVVSIRRTVSRSGGRVVFGEPKTKKSRRSIHLTPQAVEALRSHLKRQLRDMEILGDHYLEGEVLTCEGCSAELEVVGLKPLRLAEAPEVEEDWGE